MPAKKTTTKKPVKRTTKKAAKPSFDMMNANTAWAVAVLFFGAFLGTLIHGMSWSQNFEGETMFVANGQTWLPVAGEPLGLIILNDATCGASCDATASVQVLRQNISPALVTETVDVSSEEGKELIETFSIRSVPQFFFDDDLGELEADDGSFFIDNLPEGFFTLKDELYHLNNGQVGFKAGKFTEKPEFADLDTEPSRGTGPILVVEFTDYQCPYCKRLHDNNKDLIAQLVEENKITYVVKDFPLNFHTDAVEYAHGAANCTLREAGQDAYWSMNETIFADMDSWSGKGDVGKDFLTAKAVALGANNVEKCLADPAMRQEQDADQAEGYLYGVAGTPALFIGGQVMPGAIDAATFGAAVEAELAKQ